METIAQFQVSKYHLKHRHLQNISNWLLFGFIASNALFSIVWRSYYPVNRSCEGLLAPYIVKLINFKKGDI